MFNLTSYSTLWVHFLKEVVQRESNFKWRCVSDAVKKLWINRRYCILFVFASFQKEKLYYMYLYFKGYIIHEVNPKVKMILKTYQKQKELNMIILSFLKFRWDHVNFILWTILENIYFIDCLKRVSCYIIMATCCSRTY